MLEKQLAALLASHLGLFIRDLNEDQLRISLWSGEVTLHNLVLQPDVLERITEVLLHSSNAAAGQTSSPSLESETAAKKALLLPFTVVKGVIQELRLHIPWMSLDSEAVRVEVTGVDLVFAPLRAKPFSPQEESRRREVMKEEQLAEYETRRQATQSTDTARKPVAEDADVSGPSTPVQARDTAASPMSPISPTSTTFVQRLMQSMYRNVRVITRHVSIRYVLDYPGLDPSLACAFSVWLDEISFSPASNDFSHAAFLPTSSAASGTGAGPLAPECRAAQLTNLRLAVHAHRLSDPALFSVPASQWTHAALPTFAQAWRHSETVLHCDVVQLHVKQVPGAASSNGPEVPVVAVSVSLGDRLHVDVSFGAIALVRHVCQSVTHGFTGVSYRHFLPLLPDCARTNDSAPTQTRQRWAFALACVAQDVRRARRLDDYASVRQARAASAEASATDKPRVRLDRIVAFGQLRREYCDLWKRSRSFYWLPPLETSEATRMAELESQASLSQLVLLRAFAYAEIDVEHAQRLQQDAWIAEKTGRSPAGASGPRKSAGSGLLRWFGLGDSEPEEGTVSEHIPLSEVDVLLQQRLGNANTYTFRDLSGCAEPLHTSFEAEWALAREFLDERQAARTPKLFSLSHVLNHGAPAGARGTATSPAAAASRISVSLRVVATKVRLTVRPQCHSRVTPASASLGRELFLQHLHQELIFQLTGFEYFFSSAVEPREDKARMSLYVKSFSAHFAGVLSTPLFLSREGTASRVASASATPPRKSDSAVGEEDFVVVKQNATLTRLTVTLASFVVVLRPLHEMYWWTHDARLLLAHMMDETPALRCSAGATPGPAPSFPPAPPADTAESDRTPVLMDCTVAPFAVLVPLFAHDLSFTDLESCAPTYLASSPNSVVGSLNSTAAPDDISAASYGSFGSLMGSCANHECLVLQGEPCLTLSVPSGVRVTTVTGADKRHPGPGSEFYFRVGDANKSVHLSCQTAGGTATTMPGRLPQTRRRNIFSFSMLEVVLNPVEIGVVLETGLEATLDPHVAGLINDQLLRPDVLYGSAEQHRATASLWANVAHARDQWRLASARELVLRDGEVVLTLRETEARHYVSVLAQHHAKSHPQWCLAAASPPRPAPVPAPHALTSPPQALSRRRIAFMTGLVKLRLYDENGLELLDAELVNPQEEEVAPAASAPYRNALSFFGGGPRALEVVLDMSDPHGMLLFACAPDLSINTALGASVATMSQLCVTVRQDKRSQALHMTPSLRSVRVVMGEECRAAVRVLARVSHTLVFPDVEAGIHTLDGAPQLTETAESSVSVRGPKTRWGVHCLVTAESVSLFLPLSRELGMTGCALDVNLRAVRVAIESCAAVPLPRSSIGAEDATAYATRCEVDAVLLEALRVTEDVADQDDQSVVVLGPLRHTPPLRTDETVPPSPAGAMVHVRFLVPFSDPSAAPHAATPPELHVDVSDAHLSAYMPFILHLFYTMKDPLYTELAAAWHIAGAEQDLLTSRLLVPRRASVRDGPRGEDSPDSPAVSPPRQEIPTLSVTLTRVELFLPTNNALPVSVEDDTSFFLLFADELTIREKRLHDGLGVMQRRLLVESTSLHYHDGRLGSLQPLSAHLTVSVEFGVLLVPKQADSIASSFHYVAAKPGDACVRISIASLKRASQAPDQTAAASALTLSLQASRVVALVKMIQFNLGRPLFPAGVVPSRRPGASTIMVTTAPLDVTVRDHKESPAFRVQLTDGFQYYKAGGGQWEQCPSQRVFLSGIELEACAGGLADTQPASEATCPRLLSSRAARLITEITSDAAHLEKSISTVVEVDSANVSLDAPRAWLVLHDLLLEPCLRALAEDAAVREDFSRQPSNTSLSSRSSCFTRTDRRELVTADVRVGVRSIAVRLGDGFRLPQLVLGVPECLVSTHVPARGEPADVTVSVLTTPATPPTLQVYYRHAAGADGGSAAVANATTLCCADLLAWGDGSGSVDEVGHAGRSAADHESAAAPACSPGLELNYAVARSEGPLPTATSMPRLTLSVRALRLLPRLDGYAACVRLCHALWPPVRALLDERTRLRQTFSVGAPAAPSDEAPAPRCEMRLVVSTLAIALSVEPAAEELPWLTVHRIEAASPDTSMNVSPSEEALAVRVDGVRVHFPNLYPITFPLVTCCCTRTATTNSRETHSLHVSATLHGRGPSLHEAILFSMPHLLAAAACLDKLRNELPPLRAALADLATAASGSATERATPSLVWSAEATIHRLDVALTASEYTSGDHRLRLTCTDPVSLRIAAPTAPLLESRASRRLTLTVQGGCLLSNGDGQTLAHRDTPGSPKHDTHDEEDGEDEELSHPERYARHSVDRDNDKERDQVSPTLILSTDLDDTPAARTIEVTTTGLRICASHGTLAYARRLSKSLRPEVEELLVALRRPSQSLAAESVHATMEVPRLRLVVHSMAAEIGHDALIELRDVQLEPSALQQMQQVLGDKDRGARPAGVSPVSTEDVTLTVGSVLLQARRTGLVHASLHRPSLTVRTDNVLRVVLPRLLVCSDGSPFFVDLLHSALVWQAFVRAEATRAEVRTRTTTEAVRPPWLRGVSVDARDIHVQCHHSPSTSTPQTRAYVELQISSLEARHQCGDVSGPESSATTTSVDAKGCLVVLRDAQDVALDGTLPPIVHRLDLSLRVEPGRDAVSGVAQTQVALRASPVTVHLPMGEVLAHCTESLARAVLPLVNYARSDTAYRAFRNRLSSAEAVQLTVSHDAQGRIVSAVPQDTALVPLSSTIPAHALGGIDTVTPQVGVSRRLSNFFRFTLYVPHVTIAFSHFADHRAGGHLFAGLQLHEVSAERSRGAQSSVVLLAIRQMTSQSEDASVFTCRTNARRDGAVAVQWRDEVLRFASPDVAETAVEKHARTLLVADAELVVSPAFLIVLNERCIAPVVAGLSAAVLGHAEDALLATNADGSVSAQRDHGASRAPPTSYQSYHDPLDVDSDLLLQRDLVLGGPSGIQLRFCKSAEFGARNTLTVRSVNHARLVLQPMPMTGAPPIIVQEGLTVVIESTPVVLVTHGGSSDTRPTVPLSETLGAYVRLGMRSVLLVPDAALVEFHAPTTPPPARWGAPQPSAAVGDTKPENGLHRCHELSVSVGLDARLQARHESVQLRTQVVGTYTRETRTSLRDKKKMNASDCPSVVTLLAERGEFQTTHLWFACSDGPVTELRDGVSLHVARRDDRTTAHVVVAPLRFTVSRNHLRLLYGALAQVVHGQRRLRRVGLLSANAAAAGNGTDESLPPDQNHSSTSAYPNHAQENHFNASGSTTRLGGAVVLGDTSADASKTVDPAHSSDDDNDGSGGASATTVELRVTAPQVEVVVGDDFFTPLASVAIEAVTLAANADRALEAIAGVGAFTVRLTDYPCLVRRRSHRHAEETHQRTLLTVSPEVALQVDRLLGGGVCASLSVDCGDVEATVPLTRLAEALAYQWEVEQTAEPLAIHNQLGLPLLLLAAPTTGTSATAEAEPPAFVYVPDNGVQTLAVLLRHGQTVLRLVHTAEPPTAANLFNRLTYLYTVGTEVDLRQLSNGQTCRFPLEGSGLGVSTGVLDVVLWFDPVRRVVCATSAVRLVNDLHDHTVQWHTRTATATASAAGQDATEQLTHARTQPCAMSVLMPGDALHVPLPLLQQPIALSVDGNAYSYDAPPEGALPLESLLTAWTLCPTSPGGNTALKLPLWLPAPDQQTAPLGVQLLVEKRLAAAGTPLSGTRQRTLAKHELTCRLRPYATVVNLIGVTATLELCPSSSANTTDSPSEPLPPQRHVLEHGAQFDWYPTSPAEAARPPLFHLEVHVPDSLAQRGVTTTASPPPRTPHGLMLRALRPHPLVADQLAEEQVLLPLGGTSDGKPAAVLAHRLACGTVHLVPLATVENTLSVPIHVCFAGQGTAASSAVLGGAVSQVFPNEQLPILWPTQKHKERDDPVKVCVGAGSRTSEVSFPVFIHGTLNPLATTLSSLEANGGVHVFSAEVTNLAAALADPCTPPVLSIRPLWTVRNEHPSMSLRVRLTAGDAPAQKEAEQSASLWPPHVEVEPLCEQPLTYFRGDVRDQVVEPCAAFQYVLSARDLDVEQPSTFAWSGAILLGEVATAASYVTLRHELVFVGASGAALMTPPESSDFAVFHDRAVPTFYGDVVSDTYFGCLSVSTRVDTGNRCTFHVRLARGGDPAPVLVENRTGYTIQCGQALPLSSASAPRAAGDGRTTLVAAKRADKLHDIVVAAYMDSAMCWIEPFLGMPSLQLTAYRNAVSSTARARHTTTQDLRWLASANEPVPLGDSPLFVYVSPHRRDGRCFVVTVMDTRKLASQLLFFPRTVGHFELTVKSVSLCVASTCVRSQQHGLDDTPLGALARQGLLRTVPLEPHEANGKGEDEAVVFDALKRSELDLVLIRLTNLGVSAIANEKYLLVGVGVGGMAVQDCTSLAPRFPVVAQVAPVTPETPSKTSTDGAGALVFMGSMQFQWPHFGRTHGGAAAMPDASEVSPPFSPCGAAAETTASTLTIEEVSAALGTVTVCLDDRFLTVCRDALECVVAAVQKSPGRSYAVSDRSIELSLTSLGATMTTADLASSSSRRHMPVDSGKDDRMGDVSVDATARQLLRTQRAMRAREVRGASPVDCYVSFLDIGTVRVVLTLDMSPADHDAWRPFDGLPLFGLEIPSVDRAPLRLKALALRDLVRRGDSVAALLAAVLWSAYRGQLFAQACRVVASLAILGNPLALAEGWSRGVRALFDDAVVRGQPLVGTRAFVSQVTSSTLHSVGLISSAGSRALLTLVRGSGSTPWRPTASSTAELTTAASAPAGPPRRSSRFLRELAAGMSGVVVAPLRGARSAGLQGFLRGVTTGLVGAVTRPVAGALSDVSGAAESFSQQLQRESSATLVPAAMDKTTLDARDWPMIVDDTMRQRNFTRPHRHATADQEREPDLLARPLVSARTDAPVYGFASPAAYQAALNEASQQGLFQHDGARRVIDRLGAHNYALYATYKAFLRDTTPAEFSNWVEVALDAHLARELPQLLDAHGQAQHTHAAAPVGRVPDLERARNIKATLGIPALLKHASLEEVVQVCTVKELRANVVAEDLQAKCGLLLAHRAVSELSAALNGSA